MRSPRENRVMSQTAEGTPGTGGGLRYLTEDAAPDMVNQEQSHSCQAACARQLLRDAGIDLSEAELLAKIGYIKGWGTTVDSTARALDELHPRLGYAGGVAEEEKLPILFRRDPWIASLKTYRGTVHATRSPISATGRLHFYRFTNRVCLLCDFYPCTAPPHVRHQRTHMPETLTTHGEGTASQVFRSISPEQVARFRVRKTI